jgi:ribosomal protein S6E (S10)
MSNMWKKSVRGFEISTAVGVILMVISETEEVISSALSLF